MHVGDSEYPSTWYSIISSPPQPPYTPSSLKSYCVISVGAARGGADGDRIKGKLHTGVPDQRSASVVRMAVCPSRCHQFSSTPPSSRAQRRQYPQPVHPGILCTTLKHPFLIETDVIKGSVKLAQVVYYCPESLYHEDAKKIEGL